MGLIKSGIKYGAIFMIAKEGLKAFENHKGNQNNQQQQSQQQQQQQQPLLSRSVEPTPYYMQPAQQSQDHPRSAAGSFHQHWCNGTCGGSCIPPETWKSLGVDGNNDVSPPKY